MADGVTAHASAPRKFMDPEMTLGGAPRARVPFARLTTLWVNTGTLCNVECANCYIESSPTNDRLAYFSRQELAPFLAEARKMDAAEIGFTGGEPFLNPDLVAMARDALAAEFRTLVLTNAMRPYQRPGVRKGVADLAHEFGERLTLRVSLDHHTAERHDRERGPGAFAAAITGLQMMIADGVAVSIAGRRNADETERDAREGYAALFAGIGLVLDVADPSALVLFPEMDETADTPEITAQCWDILGKSPTDVMCATSRMLVKRKGDAAPSVVACTLIPYDAAFALGATIRGSTKDIPLNHPHCSRFCVLGGASCS